MPSDTMRLSCPNCATEYEVPDAALAGRSRKLRCAHCGTEWRSAAPDSERILSAAAPAWPVDPAEPAPAAEKPFEWAAAPEPQYAPQFTQDDEASQPAPPAPEWPSTTEPAWEPAAEGLNRFPPAKPRSFVFPMDEEAQREVAEAMRQEEANHAAASVPAPGPESTSQNQIGDALPEFLSRPAPDETETTGTPDRFAELVYAARNKGIEFEPEPPPPSPPVRTSKSPLFVILLLLFLIAFILLEHRAVAHVIPASIKLFHALGLK
jgi:predicted Zn finger-like uncharacterized protein